MLCPACQSSCDESATACFECGAALTPAIRKGSIIATRYEILRSLGKGGMGMVYLAHDRELDEQVALKVLRSEMEESAESGSRFRSEIRLARRVAHKNVCRIFDYGQDGSRPFITMAYVEGMDLRRVLRERGPLPLDQAFDVAIHVADALAAIHDEGIVHRDLKTPNIMLDAKGVVRVMDFGIAKEIEPSGQDLTQAGSIIGSPEYLSPERWHGTRADVRSDVYALGIVTFELFTARLPFAADSSSGLMWKHLQVLPVLDGLPEPLRPVVACALAKDPAQRFAAASEMAEALREARRHCGVGRTPPPLPMAARTPAAFPPGMPPLPPAWRGAAVPQAWTPNPALEPTGIPTMSPTVAPTPRGTHPAMASRPPPYPPPPFSVTPPAHPAAALSNRRSTKRAIGAGAIVVGLLGGLTMALDILKNELASTPTSTVPARSAATGRPPPAAAPRTVPAADPRAPRAAPLVPAPAAAAETGTLRVSAVPPADVTVDGTRVTGALRKIVLSRGTHLVRLEAPGYQPIQRAVRIRAGEVTSLEIDFAEDGVRRGR